jgi:hypothetical protein
MTHNPTIKNNNDFFILSSRNRDNLDNKLVDRLLMSNTFVHCTFLFHTNDRQQNLAWLDSCRPVFYSPWLFTQSLSLLLLLRVHWSCGTGKITWEISFSKSHLFYHLVQNAQCWRPIFKYNALLPNEPPFRLNYLFEKDFLSVFAVLKHMDNKKTDAIFMEWFRIVCAHSW